MRINKQVSALSLLVLVIAGCSNSTPQQAQSAPEAVEPSRPAPEAPAVVSRPATAVKVKRAPAAPVASAPVVEPPRETAVNLPPVSDRQPFPEPAPAAVPVVAPPPPPEPTRQVTIPSGTRVSVRMTDPVDSETARVGQTFRATLDTPLTADRETLAPRGTEVYLRLTHVESAGSLTGRSHVALELDRIVVDGKSYTVASNTYEKQGASQTVETAKKTGIGAGIGAAIGAIAGGGKGAAIGAGIGGGAGVAIEAATKGKQVRIEPESQVDFRLEHPLEVTVDARPYSSPAQRDNSSSPRLLNGRVAERADNDFGGQSLSGKWRVSMDSPQGYRNLDMTLRESGDRLEGTIYDRGRGQALRGSMRGDSISFSTDSGMRFEGRIVGSRLRGTVTSQDRQSFNWTADRND
jgi:hypothetical protein